MIYLLGFLLAFWLTTQITFILYLSIMNAIKNREFISKPAWFFIGPMVLVGVIFDFLLNVIFGTVMFLDPPREALFTSRLHRYRDKNYSKWRKTMAKWICEKLLNAYDPTGKHC